MPKNIVICSDGTGQAGGLRPDQNLSNIYKLYRAARVGPDNAIDPREQIAFYDAGVGTENDEGHIPLRGRAVVSPAVERRHRRRPEPEHRGLL